MEEIEGVVKESASEKEIEKRKNSLKKKLFSWVEDNYDKVFLFILVASFIIEIIIFMKTSQQPLWYDEASYMATAQRIATHLNINDIWYYRRGFLWPLFSIPFYFLGIGEIGIRITEVLFSVGITAVSFFLIKEMFNKKVAVYVSAAVSLSWIVLFYTGRVLTDTPSTFFILLSLLFFWKGYVSKKGNKYLYLFGLFLALSVLTRMQNLMFIPAFLFFILIKDKFKFVKNKHLWIAFGIFALFLIPQGVLYYTHYGNPLNDILEHYLGVNTGGTTAVNPDVTVKTVFQYFTDLPYILGGQIAYGKIVFFLFLLGVLLFFADMFIGIDKILKDSEIQKKFFIFLWILIPLLVLGYMMPAYPDERYVMPILMFFFVIAIYPLEKAGKFLTKKTKMSEKSSQILVFIVILLIFIPSMIWGFQVTDAKKTSYLEVKEAGLWLNQNSNPSDIIISPSQPQIEYYSQRSTYTEGANETEFKQEISQYKPKYLVLSAYEPTNLPWLLNYTQQNTNTIKPVMAYPQDSQQPILIIYQISYPNQ